MTPVGHSMVGLSVGVFCMPQWQTTRAKALFLTSFVVLANLPDCPVPRWGHDQYMVSHSLLVNLALIVLVVVALRIGRKAVPSIASWPVLIGGAIAWLSHLLLDSFYNHGHGIRIYWPLSQKELALPLPWFSSLDRIPPPLNAHTLRICLMEFVFYLPLLLLAIYWRHHRLHSILRQ